MVDIKQALKISDMIKVLQETMKREGDIPVLIEGYETGFDMFNLRYNIVTPDPDPCRYEGTFMACWGHYRKSATQALILERAKDPEVTGSDWEPHKESPEGDMNNLGEKLKKSHWYDGSY